MNRPNYLVCISYIDNEDNFTFITQPVFTGSKLRIETLE